MRLRDQTDQGSASSAIVLVYIGIVFVATLLTGAPLIADLLSNLAKVLSVR